MTNTARYRKSLVTLVAAALLSTPALSFAAPLAASPLQGAGTWTASPLIGLDLPTFSGASAGVRLGGEAMYGLGEIAPKLHLDVGPRLTYTYNGGDSSLWTLDFLATGRLSYEVSPQLAVYGDAGLGIAYAHVSFGGLSDDATMFDLMLAPGVIYALSPTMNLFGEVGFYVNAKSGYGTHVTIPTIGLQFKL